MRLVVAVETFDILGHEKVLLFVCLKGRLGSCCVCVFVWGVA